MTTKQLYLEINDIDALHRYYMPMVKDGGLFIPTPESFQFHESVVAQVFLKFQKRKIMLPGMVVWIAPQGARGEGAGVGIRFTGEHKNKVKQFIEVQIGSKLSKIPHIIAY